MRERAAKPSCPPASVLRRSVPAQNPGCGRLRPGAAPNARYAIRLDVLPCCKTPFRQERKSPRNRAEFSAERTGRFRRQWSGLSGPKKSGRAGRKRAFSAAAVCDPGCREQCSTLLQNACPTGEKIESEHGSGGSRRVRPPPASKANGAPHEIRVENRDLRSCGVFRPMSALRSPSECSTLLQNADFTGERSVQNKGRDGGGAGTGFRGGEGEREQRRAGRRDGLKWGHFPARVNVLPCCKTPAPSGTKYRAQQRRTYQSHQRA